MSKGISTGQVIADLIGGYHLDYNYDSNDLNEVWVEHYEEDGRIIGTQAITVTLGEFKATE